MHRNDYLIKVLIKHNMWLKQYSICLGTMLNNDQTLYVLEPLFKNIGVISILIKHDLCFKYSIPRHFEDTMYA
jgi:hypothetical protein